MLLFTCFTVASYRALVQLKIFFTFTSTGGYRKSYPLGHPKTAQLSGMQHRKQGIEKRTENHLQLTGV